MSKILEMKEFRTLILIWGFGEVLFFIFQDTIQFAKEFLKSTMLDQAIFGWHIFPLMILGLIWMIEKHKVVLSSEDNKD